MNLLSRPITSDFKLESDIQSMKRYHNAGFDYPQDYSYPGNGLTTENTYTQNINQESHYLPGANNTNNFYNQYNQPIQNSTSRSHTSNYSNPTTNSFYNSSQTQNDDHEFYYNNWEESNSVATEPVEVPQNRQYPINQRHYLSRSYPQPQMSGYQFQHQIVPPLQGGNSMQVSPVMHPMIDQHSNYTVPHAASQPSTLCYVKVEEEAPPLNQYPDMTTMVNSNTNIIVPLVETQFVDKTICTVCGKKITRDMLRHMRTHRPYARFNCKFPKSQCKHKYGKFNRPYDFKKHLLNRHFKFDSPNVKKYHNLSDKLNHWGTCSCGLRFLSNYWLDEHVLTTDIEKRCPLIED